MIRVLRSLSGVQSTNGTQTAETKCAIKGDFDSSVFSGREQLNISAASYNSF